MALIEKGALGMSDAQRLTIAVATTLQVAADVAAERVHNPGACPTLPEDFVGCLTRKLLGDLVEFGVTPDGWQTEFMGPITNGWGSSRGGLGEG